MTKKYKRIATEVIATQLTVEQSHPAVISKVVSYYGDNNDIPLSLNYIKTDFGEVQIEFGDWIVEINGKIKVLKDEYFKENYQLVPEVVSRKKLIIVNDCV